MTSQGYSRGIPPTFAAITLGCLAPGALRHRRREDRIAHFGSLIMLPGFAGSALARSKLGKRSHPSPVHVVLVTASLELLSSCRASSTSITTSTRFIGSEGSPRLFLVCISVLGVAGFVSAVAVAVQALEQRRI